MWGWGMDPVYQSETEPRDIGEQKLSNLVGFFSICGNEKKKKVNKFCQIAVHFKKFQNSPKMSRSVENILLQVNHVKHKKYEGTLYLMGERLAWMASHKNDTFSGMYFFSFSKPLSKLYKIFWIRFSYNFFLHKTFPYNTPCKISKNTFQIHSM